MRKVKLLVVTAVFVAVPLLGARPASAMTCSPDLTPVCSAVARVVCGVVAKGKPCLA